ncbi:hypothetical protein ACLOJK_041318 [Asimina triloba]
MAAGSLLCVAYASPTNFKEATSSPDGTRHVARPTELLPAAITSAQQRLDRSNWNRLLVELKGIVFALDYECSVFLILPPHSLTRVSEC